MASTFLTLEGVSVQLAGARLLDHLDWTIQRGEQWAITGPSGSGKTILAHTLLGRHFSTGRLSLAAQRVAMVEQQHRFRNRPGATELYYQQRFNSSDADQTMTVEQELTDAGWPGLTPVQVPGNSPGISHIPAPATKASSLPHPPAPATVAAHWLDTLHVRPLLKKPLIQLSNGENKRVQLAIALLDEPELLILDNPFLGLDTEGRATLHMIINDLAARGIQLLLITVPGEIPAAITHVARLEKGRLTWQGPRAAFQPQKEERTIRLDAGILTQLKQTAETNGNGHEFSIAVKMVDTTIKYGEATILDKINWEVKKGEKWNVSGPNGAGKSTILSLITADNPQAYANEIWLFDRRRGSGESIWDIKKKIGFVSPELHLYFDYSANAFEVIASGLFDTIGLFRPLNTEQEVIVGLWMRFLSIQDLRTQRLNSLSTSQQRMVLLARALIKNPPMLILDEPCQGLDDAQTQNFRELITLLCEAFGTTLVYVSHYRQELPACIDHFLQLDKGKMTITS